jgi:enoyl-CoA hydratase/carnithine racemase
MNLLSAPALDELEQVLIQLPDTTEVLFFESAHPAVFAAGADMSEMARFSALDAVPFSERGQRVFALIEAMPMVTVAMVDGDCFGGALDLVLAFDYRWASERARFSHPGGRIGIVTGFGGTARWRHVLGNVVARRLFLGNEVLSAADAEVAGLVDRVIDDPASITDGDVLLLDARAPEEIEMVKSLSGAGSRGPGELLGLARRLASVYALTAHR